MSRRSKARETALQLLFQDDLNSDSDEAVRNKFVRGRLRNDEKLTEFANQLVDGVRKHKAEIDELLESAAENWRLSRMAVTDRNVLRIGTYEVMFSDTPDAVAVNEAIELAKRYGTNNSAQFVNGVLDRLIKSKIPESDSNQKLSPDDEPKDSEEE